MSRSRRPTNHTWKASCCWRAESAPALVVIAVAVRAAVAVRGGRLRRGDGGRRRAVVVVVLFVGLGVVALALVVALVRFFRHFLADAAVAVLVVGELLHEVA